MDNEGVVRRYLAAVERFDVAAMQGLLHRDVVQIEFPNRLNPKGQKRGREALIADMARGAKLLARQAYPVATLTAQGDTVVVESPWEGVLNVEVGALRPGDSMVADVCMVFTLSEGKIIAQRNYDCFGAFDGN